MNTHKHYHIRININKSILRILLLNTQKYLKTIENGRYYYKSFNTELKLLINHADKYFVYGDNTCQFIERFNARRKHILENKYVDPFTVIEKQKALDDLYDYICYTYETIDKGLKYERRKRT